MPMDPFFLDFIGAAVLLLYKPNHEESELMIRILKHLAEKFPRIRFRKLLGNEAVKNFPPDQCPTLMVYENGKVVRCLVSVIECCFSFSYCIYSLSQLRLDEIWHAFWTPDMHLIC